MRFWLLLLAGCYEPGTPGACEITCSAVSPCPNGLVCNPEGLCAATADPGTCGTPTDSSEADGAPAHADCYSYSSADQICIDQPSGQIQLGTSFGVPLVDTLAFTECLDAGAYTVLPGPLDVCVVARDEIDIDGQLRVTGLRPLVLIARTTLTFPNTAQVDVSSTRFAPSINGPGARGTCNAFAREAGAMSAGSGGGAGGSYKTTGGTGAAGSGAVGGVPAPVDIATFALRGGCRGQDGAEFTQGKGTGGAGGGAIALLSKAAFTVSGQINASGAAGIAAVGGSAGGGGGGSGGMIAIYGPAVTLDVDSILWANGGGGGGGASGSNGNSGGESSAPTAAGPGGANAIGGTTAGSGACCALGAGGNGFASGAGGGAGGGGLGRIVVPPNVTIATTNNQSPAVEKN